MVDKKITELNELTTPASADVFPIEDIDATETKKITYDNLISNASFTASQVSDFDTEVSNNSEVVANTAKISYTDGADVALNTSFRTTPSTVITAGTNITWDGNTLNVSGGTSTVDWGGITGTLSDQTDLQAELDGKADSLTADQNYVTDAQLAALHTQNTDYKIELDDTKVELVDEGAGFHAVQFTVDNSLQATFVDGYFSPFVNNDLDLGLSAKRWKNLYSVDGNFSGNITVSGTVDGVDLANVALKSNVLELDNTSVFTPDADYEPATKKYVDDNAGGSGAEILVQKTAGEVLSLGDIAYLKSDGKYWKQDASAESTCSTELLMANEAISADATGEFMKYGDFSTTGLTAGAVYYASETAGEYTATAPTTSGAIIRIIGTAESTTKLTFNPDVSFAELV